MTNDKTVAELRAEGWGVVLIPPEQMLEQTGKTLNRRSEERRVGKGWRERGLADDAKNKK